MSFQTLLYEKAEGIAWITLNRPERLNALNVQMRDDLYEVMSAVRDDPEVQVVIFKGAGDRAFCAGADLTEFGSAPSPVIARQVRWERDQWGLLLGLPKPLIAAIHGFCLGSGLELSMTCDLRVAAEDARFGLPEVGLGIIPAAGGSQTLPRLVGRGRALELILTGDYLDAAEAHRIGLVNRVVPRAEIYPTAEALARKIMEKDQVVVRAAKLAVTRGLDLPLAEGLKLEAQYVGLTLPRRKRASLRGV
ncbi:MAG: enoyl-CoA hydratase/isomerase family protein [Chloroflexi bacterium]|nr:enoyl-CoA hydratase/isomerase family protein [Chloroflexota bacterium]